MSNRIQPPAATYEQELLTAARKVASLMAKRRRYRKLLRELDADLRHERKMLRALANKNDDRQPDVMPSRLTHGATGYSRDEALPAASMRAGAELLHEPFDIGDPDPVVDLVAADPSTRRQK